MDLFFITTASNFFESSNVIADLPGVGYFKAEPNLPEQIRQVFLKYPTRYPSEP
jgi:GTP-binding protein EngB required for normal cell division